MDERAGRVTGQNVQAVEEIGVHEIARNHDPVGTTRLRQDRHPKHVEAGAH